jgi:hypothetical protein
MPVLLLEKLNLPISSVLGLPLIIKEEPFGAFILTANGSGRYAAEHGLEFYFGLTITEANKEQDVAAESGRQESTSPKASKAWFTFLEVKLSWAAPKNRFRNRCQSVVAQRQVNSRMNSRDIESRSSFSLSIDMK